MIPTIYSDSHPSDSVTNDTDADLHFTRYSLAEPSYFDFVHHGDNIYHD
jgi:hypothetical protein